MSSDDTNFTIENAAAQTKAENVVKITSDGTERNCYTEAMVYRGYKYILLRLRMLYGIEATELKQATATISKASIMKGW